MNRGPRSKGYLLGVELVLANGILFRLIISLSIRPWSHLFFYSFSYRRNRRFSKILFIEQTKGLNRCIVSGLRRCLLPRFGKRRERFGAIGSASDIRTELGVQIKFRMWKSCFFCFTKPLMLFYCTKKCTSFLSRLFLSRPLNSPKTH